MRLLFPKQTNTNDIRGIFSGKYLLELYKLEGEKLGVNAPQIAKTSELSVQASGSGRKRQKVCDSDAEDVEYSDWTFHDYLPSTIPKKNVFLYNSKLWECFIDSNASDSFQDIKNENLLVTALAVPLNNDKYWEWNLTAPSARETDAIVGSFEIKVRFFSDFIPFSATDIITITKSVLLLASPASRKVFFIDENSQILATIENFHDMLELSKSSYCRSKSLKLSRKGKFTWLNMNFDFCCRIQRSVSPLWGYDVYQLSHSEMKYWFANGHPFGKNANFNINADQFLKNMAPDNENGTLLDIPLLKCSLHPFQENTVRWMLRREGFMVDDRQKLVSFESLKTTDYETYLNCKEKDHRWIRYSDQKCDFYFCPTKSCFTTSESIKPLDISYTTSGGILAEEMGLGKTVEIIALILLNPRPEDDPVETDRIISKATLIVTPAVILHQWIQEVQQKSQKLKIYHYRGIGQCEISAFDLAKYDIILIDYSVFRQEIGFARPDNGRSRRFKRKYERKVSHLIKINFWRLCIDEAQMISQNSNIGLVASYIEKYPLTILMNSYCRRKTWAVTGTPLSSQSHFATDLLNLSSLCGLEDLYMGCRGSIDCLVALFKIFLRRNSKQTLNNQVDIPPQKEHLSILEFSAIERHYYDSHRMRMLEEFNSDAINLSRQTSDIANMNQWLLRLRQTCCNPQIGVYNQVVFGNRVVTLSNMLKTMIRNVKTNVKKFHRMYLAYEVKRGILLEKMKSWEAAREKYSEIYLKLLEFIDGPEYKLELHKSETEEQESAEEISDNTINFLVACLHHQILFCIASVCLELAEKDKADEYYEKAEQVRKEIMQPREDEVLKIADTVLNQLKTNEFDKKFAEHEHVEEIIGHGIVSAFAVENVNEIIRFLNSQVERIKFYRKKFMEVAFSDLHRDYSEDAQQQNYGDLCLQHYMTSIIARKRLLILNSLGASFGAEFHSRSIHHLEVNEENAETPPEPLKYNGHHSLNTLVNSLNSKLAQIAIQEVTEDGSDDEDIHISPMEQPFIEQTIDKIRKISKSQMEFVTLLEQDFARISKLWNKRIEFYTMLQKLSDEVSIPPVSNVEMAMNACEKDIKSATDNLERERAKVRYLLNLRDHEFGGENSSEEKNCLICYENMKLKTSLGMTACGHMFCYPCISTWMVKGQKKCPSCNTQIRQKIDLKKVVLQTEDIAPDLVVKNKENDINLAKYEKFPFPSPGDLPSLEQSYGSKVDLIVKHIKYLKSRDENFKCLLFTQWNEVLHIFARSLECEGIGFLTLAGTLKVRTEIPQTFQQDPNVCVLMMNSKTQSSGLTLTCATHVFFVEPSLNPAIEWQAKGRIHRLGQTNITHVHRYIVKNSIEEEIFKMRNAREDLNMLRFDPMKAQDIGNDEASFDDVVHLLNKELDIIGLEAEDFI